MFAVFAITDVQYSLRVHLITALPFSLPGGVVQEWRAPADQRQALDDPVCWAGNTGGETGQCQ